METEAVNPFRRKMPGVGSVVGAQGKIADGDWSRPARSLRYTTLLWALSFTATDVI